jgi:predicted RNA binding protein YcfA (HicA-like mRNA interferase family)
LPKKYPPLIPKEVIEILKAQGFAFKETEGSHAQYEKGSRKVTVDMSVKEFDPFLLQSMMRQAGLDRDSFYSSTKAGAKKINNKFGR